ncbi:MAG: hypothetical protein K2R98_10110 [Gemmataceae bacterium]|nr:hypothetical protein [Gemmataceae bacterium]
MDEDKIPRRLDDLSSLDEADEQIAEAHDDLLRWLRRLIAGMFVLLGLVVFGACAGVWVDSPPPYRGLLLIGTAGLPVTILFVCAVGFVLDNSRESRRWFVGAGFLAMSCLACYGCLGFARGLW